MTPERQRQVLAGLLATLAVVIGWRVLSPSVGVGAAGSGGARGAAAGASLAALQVVPVRLADLDLEEAEFHVGRDPFRFAAPRPKPAPPPLPQPKPPAAENRSANQAPAQQTDSRPQPPPVDVVYLGRFGGTSRPIAVFSDGNEIYNVLEGGVIKGQFMVDKIGYESADLKFVGFPDAPSKRLAVGG